EPNQIDEFLRMRLDPGAIPAPPFRGHGIGNVAEHRTPRQECVALEDHGAVEARSFNPLPVDDDRALARLVEAGEDVEHRGLAAAGVADHAAELAARHREPKVFEHRGGAAAHSWIALGDALDGD